MHAEILSIGTELLMGELVDTNSSYLASELAKLGIEVRWVTKVGDDPDRLHEAIERAFRRSDITLTSGGLGPTSDDLTRETIARVCGETMTVQDDLLEHLRGLFANRGFPMPETNVKQATLIPSAEAISNPMGTAPGWWVERDGSVIVAMPGPPREIQRMWANEIAPRLKERNTGVAIATRNLKTFGISEGGLDEILSPLFKSENPLLGIYSKQDGIHLRAIATAATDAEAAALIAPMEAEIRGIIGDDAIWGFDDETPESKTIALLKKRRLDARRNRRLHGRAAVQQPYGGRGQRRRAERRRGGWQCGRSSAAWRERGNHRQAWRGKRGSGAGYGTGGARDVRRGCGHWRQPTRARIRRRQRSRRHLLHGLCDGRAHKFDVGALPYPPIADTRSRRNACAAWHGSVRSEIAIAGCDAATMT